MNNELSRKHSNIFARLFNGDVSLGITYWVYGVIVTALINSGSILISEVFPSLVFQAYYNLLINIFNILVVSYALFICIAIWRSAGKYQGNVLWSGLARFFITLGLISTVSQYILRYTTDDQSYESIKSDAALVNKGLPRMIDEITRLDLLQATTESITYNHTILGRTSSELKNNGFYEKMIPIVSNSVCGDTDLIKYLDAGKFFLYTYRDTDGKLAAEIKITRQNCP